MKFSLNQQDLQKSLNYCQGVIEKRSTLPILSNILLEANNDNLILTATDLDLIFIHKISRIFNSTSSVTSTPCSKSNKVIPSITSSHSHANGFCIVENVTISAFQ